MASFNFLPGVSVILWICISHSWWNYFTFKSFLAGAYVLFEVFLAFWTVAKLVARLNQSSVWLLTPVTMFINIWSSYWPTVHTHVFSRGQFFVHSVFHYNATTHSLTLISLISSSFSLNWTENWLTTLINSWIYCTADLWHTALTV